MSRTTRSLAQNDVVYLDDDGGRLGCSTWSVTVELRRAESPGGGTPGDNGVRGSESAPEFLELRATSRLQVRVAALMVALTFVRIDTTGRPPGR
jgi:hypothetical protein